MCHKYMQILFYNKATFPIIYSVDSNYNYQIKNSPIGLAEAEKEADPMGQAK